MRVPSLRAVVVAMLSRIGVSARINDPSPFNNQQVKHRPLLSIGRPKVTPRHTEAKLSNRWGSNQRQIRKNRRRAHAAGKKHAFRC